MDITKAVALLAVAGGMVELAKGLLPAAWIRKPQLLVGLCILASFAAVFLVRYSVWAHEQVIGDHPLDELGVGSLIVASIALAGAEAAAFLTLKAGARAVSNVGENQALPLHEVLRNVETVPDVHAGQTPDLEHPDYVFDT